eukprot:2747080-Prymnesium_polylepis.1
MQIVTETSCVTERSTEGTSSAPLVATDANSPPRARAACMLARQYIHQYGCTAPVARAYSKIGCSPMLSLKTIHTAGLGRGARTPGKFQQQLNK